MKRCLSCSARITTQTAKRCKGRCADCYRRFRSTGYDSPEYRTTRGEVLARAGGRCEWCSARFVEAGGPEVHHLRTVLTGGTHHPDNLVALCDGCHGDAHRGGGRGSVAPKRAAG